MSEHANDPHAEALFMVHRAVDLAEVAGIEGGVLVGTISPVGRLVVCMDRETAPAAPRFSTVAQAAAWMVCNDREDSYAVNELGNAISNWNRLNTSPAADVNDLRKLGQAVIDALSRAAGPSQFDDEEWK